MSVEGRDIKSSIRKMSWIDERRRHVRRLPHGFFVCLCGFYDRFLVFCLGMMRVSDNQMI